MLRAAVFDLGDTLLEYDSPTLSFKELNNIGLHGLYDYLARDGFDLPRSDSFCADLLHRIETVWLQSLMRMEGMNTVDVLRHFLPEMGIDVQGLDMDGLVWAFYRPMAPHISMYPDTYQTLTSLRAEGLLLGLISNASWPGILHDEDLDRFGLKHFFDQRSYSSELPYAKPHPEIFIHTLDALHTEPGDAAFVGDRLYDDISGAQQVGMRGILKLVDHREERSDSIEPDATIRYLSELPDVLERLFR